MAMHFFGKFNSWWPFDDIQNPGYVPPPPPIQNSPSPTYALAERATHYELVDAQDAWQTLRMQSFHHKVGGFPGNLPVMFPLGGMIGAVLDVGEQNELVVSHKVRL